MKMIMKIRRFFSYDLKTKLLLVEAYFNLGWANWILKRPFKKVTPILGNEMQETPMNNENIPIEILNHVSSAIQIMSRYTFWESKCLVQAIAAMKMLEKRGIESTLYLGTARDNTRKMIAHAWLRSGSFYVTGIKGMNQFTVVNQFAKKI